MPSLPDHRIMNSVVIVQYRKQLHVHQTALGLYFFNIANPSLMQIMLEKGCYTITVLLIPTISPFLLCHMFCILSTVRLLSSFSSHNASFSSIIWNKSSNFRVFFSHVHFVYENIIDCCKQNEDNPVNLKKCENLWDCGEHCYYKLLESLHFICSLH